MCDRQVKSRIPCLQVKLKGTSLSVQIRLQSAYRTLCLLPAGWQMANRKSTNLRSDFRNQRLQGRLGINLKYAKSTACLKHKTPKFSLSIHRTTLARNNTRKSQTRKQINSRNKCDLRVLTLVTKESIVKLNDWLLGLQSSAMSLLTLGTDTSGTPGPKGQVRKFMFPALRESRLSWSSKSLRTSGRRLVQVRIGNLRHLMDNQVFLLKTSIIQSDRNTDTAQV